MNLWFRWDRSPMNVSQLIEKRYHERLNDKVVCIVKSSNDISLEHVVYYTTSNISCSGAFILSDHPLPQDDQPVFIEFALPSKGIRLTVDGHEYYGWIKGAIIRSNSNGFAVHFNQHLELEH